jgi:hypothetical protein
MQVTSADFNPNATVQPSTAQGICGEPYFGNGTAHSICDPYYDPVLRAGRGTLVDGANGVGFANAVQCRRVIEVSRGNKLQLLFPSAAHLSLQQHEEIRIFDGQTPDSNMLVLRLVTGWSTFPIVVHSASNRLLIQFKSDGAARRTTTNSFYAPRSARWQLYWRSGIAGCLESDSADYDPRATFQPYGACGTEGARSICNPLSHSMVSNFVSTIHGSRASASGHQQYPVPPSLPKHGSIASSSHHPNLLSSGVCQRSLLVSSNDEGVHLTFDLFGIQFGDSISVYAGDSASTMTNESTLVFRLSIRDFLESTPVSIVVEGNATIEYKTTQFSASASATQARTSADGWRASYTIARIGCKQFAASNYDPFAIIEPYGACEFSALPLFSVCAAHSKPIRHGTGILQSPINSTVQPARQCRRTIATSASNIIKFQLRARDFRPGDLLAIFDGTDNSRAALMITSQPDVSGVVMCSDAWAKHSLQMKMLDVDIAVGNARRLRCWWMDLSDIERERAQALGYDSDSWNSRTFVDGCQGQHLIALDKVKAGCFISCPSDWLWDVTNGVYIPQQGLSTTYTFEPEHLLPETCQLSLNDTGLFYSSSASVTVLFSTVPMVARRDPVYSVSWTSGPPGCPKGTFSRAAGARVQLRSEVADTCSPCSIAEACVGNNVCASGYRGLWCAACENEYFILKGKCHKCPRTTWWMVCFACAAIVGFAIIMLRLSANFSNISTGSASILVTHMQVIGRILSIDAPWPPLFKQVIEWLTIIFTMNLPDLSTPECLRDFASGGGAYLFRMCLGFMLLPILCVVIYTIHACMNRCRRKSKQQPTAFVFSACVASFSTLFVTLAGAGLKTFHCIPVNGDLMLHGDRSIVCTYAGQHSIFDVLLVILVICAAVCAFLFSQLGRSATLPIAGLCICVAQVIFAADMVADSNGQEVPWRHVALFSVCMLILYLVALPVHLLFGLRDSIRYGHTQHTSGATFDVETLLSYGWFVNRFRPERWYYEFVLMGRKFAIIVITTYCTGTGTAIYSWAGCLLVIVVSIFIHRQMAPFVSNIGTVTTGRCAHSWQNLNMLEQFSLLVQLTSVLLTAYLLFVPQPVPVVASLVALGVLGINSLLLVLCVALWFEGAATTPEDLSNAIAAASAPVNEEQEIMEAMRQHAAIRRGRRSDEAQAMQMVVATFQNNGSIGIIFGGACPPTIKTVQDGGEAVLQGLRPGMVLCKVQGRKIEDLPYADVLRLIKSCRRPLELLFAAQDTPSIFNPLGSAEQPRYSALAARLEQAQAPLPGISLQGSQNQSADTSRNAEARPKSANCSFEATVSSSEGEESTASDADDGYDSI